MFLKADDTDEYENIKSVINRATQNIFKKYVVEELPDVNEADPRGLYLLKQASSSDSDHNLCLEYTIVETDDGKEWELVGGEGDGADLSNYYTKEETDSKTTLTDVEGNPNGYTLGDNDGKMLQAMLSDD